MSENEKMTAKEALCDFVSNELFKIQSEIYKTQEFKEHVKLDSILEEVTEIECLCNYISDILLEIKFLISTKRRFALGVEFGSLLEKLCTIKTEERKKRLKENSNEL